jgi:osmotically-inducible protein OsmY
MDTARLRRIGLLLVTAPGLAALAAGPPASAQAAVTPSGHEASPEEVVINATRLEDAAVTAKVVQAIKDDPYIYAGHITVVTENGVVRLQGFIYDESDLRRTLRLARKIAGKRRVLNEIEYLQVDSPQD